MSIFSSNLARASLALALSTTAATVHGAPVSAPSSSMNQQGHIVPARNALQGIIDFLGDGDNYVHDDHYDWQRYRDTTSRKERIRDYYQMQQDAQKDYWHHQKEAQKRMFKQQRGW
ncbi:hypothetical protein [Bosea rubneri]|uniref:Uncharacterized protein n=1 Tax=Bosea rubneri TaxID=3075434 RepID=A0ABU3SCD8_9HYPH|nr:hypothetical protein [Bosea sp. ZW T0_25]MDU0342356.1 hypothetical protein [Bosea sp. ZW T0_25]